MRRLRISELVTRCCFTGCAAAILMTGLTAFGQDHAAGTARVARTSAAAQAQAPAAPVSGTTAAKSPEVTERYSKFPLSFEPNWKQTDDQVKFMARGDGYVLFLTDKDAVFSLGKAPEKPSVMRMSLVGANPKPVFAGLEQLPGVSNYLIGNDQSKWHTNIPNFGKVAERNIYPGVDLLYYGTQRQLEYDFVVAPNASVNQIQIAFGGADKLHTDAQGDLVLSVAGKEDLRLHKPVAYQEINGEKQLVAANFVVKASDRVAFQVGAYDQSLPLIVDPILSYSTFLGGSGIDSASSIAVAPDNTAFIAGGTFSSDFPGAHPIQSNHGGPDDFDKDAFVAKISADGSALLYATYLGGKNQDTATSIAVDAAGNAYVGGTTISPDFPITFGSFNTECGSDGACGASFNNGGLVVSNGFLSKLNPAGTGLIYSGFVGEYENVTVNAVAVDGNGNAYVTGRTQQNFFPTVTTNGFPAPFPNGFPGVFSSGAVAPPQFTVSPTRECPPGGSVGGQILGNLWEEYVITPAITVITNGVPVTTPEVDGCFDLGIAEDSAYIMKISATGSSIAYSAYLGSETNESVGYGIAADKNGNAYVTGLTYATDFPTTLGALQTTNSGAGDAFVSIVKTDPLITGLPSFVYSTYLGGSGLDQGNGIAVDAAGNVYVAGGTNSVATSLGFTPPFGALQANCDSAIAPGPTCQGDAFVAKLNPNLSAAASLVYFTYLGGSEADSASGIAIDSLGDAFVTGSTISGALDSDSPFPVDQLAFQPTYGGGNADSFVTELNPAGGLVYSSYLGGTNTEIAGGIAVDQFGSAYVSGQTCSTDFPIANALQAVPGGNCDAYVAKVSILAGFAFNPSSLSFQAQSLNTTSQTQTITLTNGQNSQTISSVVLQGANPGDFAIAANTCGNSIAAGATCTVTISFTPTAMGIRTANLVFTDSAPTASGVQIVKLSGITSTVTLSASSLDFGFQQMGVTSNPKFVTATNSGSTPLTFSSIAASGDFAETDNCTKAPLQPGTNCIIRITYTPSAPLPSSGAVTLTDSGSGSPQLILLKGEGAQQAQATLSGASLGFSNQSVGTSSAAQTLTLSNTGNATLNISSITATGDFAETNNCGAALSANANCLINVIFTPTTAGARTGVLTVTDDAGNVPGITQTAQLSGTGLAVPVVTLSTTTLSFTGQAIGTASAAQVVTLTNTGGAALTITGVNMTGDFSEVNNCGSSVAPNANCTINVTFTPTVAGNRFGTVVFADNATNSPQTISLSGNGSPTPTASLSAASLGFTALPIGSTSPAQTVTLTNTGAAPLSVGSIAVTGDFSTTSTCGAVLSPAANCAISVTFTPAAPGTRSGLLTVTDNTGGIAGSTQTVLLSGAGQAVPLVSLSPTTLTFASTSIGTTSNAQAVTLTNTGSAALTVTGVTATGNFAQVNNCPASIAPATSCTINVTFTPMSAGNLFGTISIADNATNAPQTVSLSGTGAGPGFSVNQIAPPAAVPAGTTATFQVWVQSTGTASQPVTLTCSAPATLTCSVSPSSVISGPAPAQGDTATVSVTTALRTLAPPVSTIKIDPLTLLRHFSWTALLWMIAILMVVTLATVRRRPMTAAFGFAVVLLLVSAACGAGGSTPGVPAGTQVGNYPVTVTATSGTVTTTTQVMVQVK
ncbi:MAG TPA: choice-of-anchor D domain-containing protein [Bryobacteraceae bacterium]|nr:choice-of-anchor D domain-containing protein [Bryobacteraceae bacterium]